jgi:transcription antitermination factor NusG
MIRLTNTAAKPVVFRKPLFPGYVFLQLKADQRPTIRQNEHVAKLLEVIDQETFQKQLDQILIALESKLGVRLAPAISQGMRVRIRSGPLQGIEGLVENAPGHVDSSVTAGLYQPGRRRED